MARLSSAKCAVPHCVGARLLDGLSTIAREYYSPIPSHVAPGLPVRAGQLCNPIELHARSSDYSVQILPAMFKKLRAAQAEAKFREPRIKRSRKIETHTAEHSPLARISLLSRIPAKRRSMYRCIIELPQHELDPNIYMLSDILLRTILEDTSIDRLFYAALGRILRSPKAAAVEHMCADYLLAQLAVDRTYTSFLEYLLRNCSTIVAPRKSALLECVNDPRLRRTVANLREPSATRAFAYTDRIYYLR